ncbi:AAA family ATPase [Olleya sp. Hel_I_94]|uniref:AAA family ATPase n=1 Tax=Olleya sp. Hel_I_94 TaxID=1250001 RepID=UPI0011A033D0|nr:AAA family ATPase [Olleya sp. Hel_I_94]TVZ47468.1 putative AbiEii toxin of type IV toxin-antitoxin system [Olleya sp. Hel_I_94]
MELLALYIDNHFLLQKPEYFNFGGTFIFDFKLIDDKLNIEKKENPKYIKNFFGDKISNISAIVGNNGVGKTSIMSVLNRDTKCEIISIYLDDDKIIINNQSKIAFKTDFKYDALGASEELYPLYYSTHIDYNLKSISSVISQSNLIKDSLEDYYYDTILRQVFFLNGKGQFLQKNYQDIPFYENLVIKVNQVNKSTFLNSDFYRDATIGKYINKQLEMLWNHYAISNETAIHGNFNFLNNFEVFILSLLVTDDTFAQTNSNGNNFGFQDILDAEDFDKKLLVFLKKRLDNIDGPLYRFLEEKVEITFDKTEELIKKIESYPISKIAGGFEFGQMKNHAIQTIKRFLAIWNLYNFLFKNTEIFIFEKPNELNLSVKKDPSEDFLKTFIKLYQNVHESIQYIQFEFRIFNIFPEKRLSTGEQSLLNFYSSIYSFVRKGEQHIRQHKQYLLLLDEPETGYHATWKKKFIKSITEILPELFNELNQKPTIQIVFTTHDALTLSDIPNNNITYLKKLENSIIKVFKDDDPEKPQKSFGANITDLLADSFFVDDGLMGDFAKEKIQETIDWLNSFINEDIVNPEVAIDIINQHEALIKIIDEPLLNYKLTEMFQTVFPNRIDKENTVKQIRDLAEKAGIDLKDLT